MNNTIELPEVTLTTTSLTTALVRSMENRNKGYKDPAAFAPSVRRPGVGVFDAEARQPVDTVDGLLELLSAVDESLLKVEGGYHGADHLTTTVVRVPLPQGYVARVPRLRLRHIPESYFSEVEPVWLDARPGRAASVELLCGSLDPVWADKALMEVPKEVILQYNVLTVKLDESGSIKSWFPGLDTQSDLCTSLGDQFVLVGPFYNQKGNIQYRSKKR